MSNHVQVCPQCPRKYKAIGGDGPQPSRILVVAERPGEIENRFGRVLVGKTGQEFDELYLPLAGLDRVDVRCCNTVLCWADSNRTPTEKEALHCATHHLPGEIERTQPEVIMLMGATACSLVPGLHLERMHGIPQHTRKVGELFGWSGWLVPMYHPSMGLHESKWITILMNDWQGLNKILAESHFVNDPPEPPHIYTHASTVSEIDSYFAACPYDYSEAGVDTESHQGVPWSVQASVASGTGVLVRTTNKSALERLGWWLLNVQFDRPLVFHNAAYDLEVLRKLGLWPVRKWIDTMALAYHQGDLPQGLKTLVYRLFRHTMTSYEDVVQPASVQALQEWLMSALIVAQDDLSTFKVEQLKTKVRKTIKKSEFESLLLRLLRLTDETSDYDPWERLREFDNDLVDGWQMDCVTDTIGSYPRLGIANCSMERAVAYACSDADWTRQTARVLHGHAFDLFKIQEGDRDR